MHKEGKTCLKSSSLRTLLNLQDSMCSLLLVLTEKIIIIISELWDKPTFSSPVLPFVPFSIFYNTSRLRYIWVCSPWVLLCTEHFQNQMRVITKLHLYLGKKSWRLPGVRASELSYAVSFGLTTCFHMSNNIISDFLTKGEARIFR